MSNMQKYDLRKENLRRVMHDRFRGRQVALATAACIETANYISQIFSGKKRLGEDLARKIEANLGLAEGWLDVNHAQQNTEAHEKTTVYQPHLTARQQAMLEQMAFLTEKQQDRLIELAREQASENQEIMALLTRARSS